MSFAAASCSRHNSHGLRTILNLDLKLKGGVIGISRREDAEDRWFLTSHKRAAITRSVKEMCGVAQVKRREDVEN